MAVGLDRLERKLEKLERFFKKRRVSAEGSTTTNPSSSKSDSIFRTFPQPPFIRPTSTRMLAREELSLPVRPTQRSQSLPEPPSTPRLLSLTSDEAEPTASLAPLPLSSPRLSQPPRIPKRSSSLSPNRRPASLASLAELLEFSFANPPRQRAFAQSTSLTSRSRSGSISPRAQLDRKRHSDVPDRTQLSLRQQYQALTPPPSAEHDKTFDPAALVFQATPKPGDLTPAPSPRLVPLLEAEPNELETSRGIMPQRPKSLDAGYKFSRESRNTLRKSLSFSTLAELRSTSRDNLKEPALGDFLTLSDDDIADDASATLTATSDSSQSETPGLLDSLMPAMPSSPARETLPAVTASPARINTPTQFSAASKPPTFALPPSPPVLASPPQISPGTRLLTLSPPLATRPATAAAFEAARIATKYRFDLVYVVNLWPSRLGSFQDSSSAQSPSSDLFSPVSPTTGNSRVELTGRLLAAYGLPSVVSPFRISNSVHLRVLRKDGWMEFRYDDAKSDEFSRGYCRAFYTGHSPDGRERQGDGDSNEFKSRRRRSPLPNRGIVFAAYRLPLPDKTNLDTDAEELEDLCLDAETLVDMLIDIHMTQRQRRPTASRRCIPSDTASPSRIGTSFLAI